MAAIPTQPLGQMTTPTGLGVSVESVSKIYAVGPAYRRQQVTAIDSVNLTIAPGEFTAILGPSGCGKSTLLRMIASLEQPSSGHIRFTDQAIADVDHSDQAKRAFIAYVFQDAHLLPWRNVWRNVALPLELMKIPKPHRKTIATQALQRVGLADAMDRYPAQLSGGMRMRVSLARALVTRPRLLLMDEPFAALDAITRQQLDQQLRQLWLQSRMTILFVTHATEEATYLAQRAIVLSQRPAKIIADQPINLPLERPLSIRGLPEFAHASAQIYQALEQSSPAPLQAGPKAVAQEPQR